MVDGQVVSTYERTQVDGERQADNVLFMHRDILGNADRITDSQGKLVMSRNFTPYGEELPEQVASPEGVEDDSTVKTKVYQRIEAALASDASGDLIDTALYNRYRIGQQQLSSYKHFNKEITSTEEAATDQSTDGSSTTETQDISDDTVTGVEQALANLQATPQMAISEIDLSQEIGKLKQTEEKLQLGNTIAKSRQRGYTGHEHIKEVGLINMNARLYDPVIARFISADSQIPEPGMSQAYNRYAYTIGNPVKYTDPDGHWWLFAAGLVMYLASQTIVEDPQLAQAMAIAGIVMMGAGAGGVTGLSGGATAAAANGALVGGTMGFLNSGGAIIEGAKGAVIGGVTGAATYNIGHGSGGKHVVGSNVVAQAATHGVVQGVISEASGGNFRTGFIGGATGHVAGKATQGVMQGDTTGPAVAARTSIAAIFGGTAAHVTGGNFGQGAYHAAMVHLFNGEGGEQVADSELTADEQSYLNGLAGKNRSVARNMNEEEFDSNYSSYAKQGRDFGGFILEKNLTDYATDKLYRSGAQHIKEFGADVVSSVVTGANKASVIQATASTVTRFKSFIGGGGDYPNLYIGCQYGQGCSTYRVTE